MKKSQAVQLMKLAMEDTYWDPEKILDNLVQIGLIERPWYQNREQPFTDPADPHGNWSSVNEVNDWMPEDYYNDYKCQECGKPVKWKPGIDHWDYVLCTEGDTKCLEEFLGLNDYLDTPTPV
jgi:hypothetical protein